MNYDVSPSPKKRKKRIRKLLIYVIIIVTISELWLKWPGFLYPNIIRGKLLDVSINPDGTLWILTDGSIGYSFSQNEMSYEPRGWFCKTYLYRYDPTNHKVQKKIISKLTDLPGDCGLFRDKDKLWCIGRKMVQPWIINVYKSETGEQLMDINKFRNRFSELTVGISSVYPEDDPGRIAIGTKDGRKFVYLIGDDLLLPDINDTVKVKIKEYYQSQGLQYVMAFVKTPESESRQQLYRFQGSTDYLCSELIRQYEDLNILNYHGSFTCLNSNKVYLEPAAIYRDQELVVFLHQDQVGSDAQRFLTCTAANGKEKWNVSPDKLFPKLMLSKDNAFSDRGILRPWHLVIGKRQQNKFVLGVKQGGIIGFDLNSGKELWRIKTK